MNLNSHFTRFSHAAARFAGHPLMFLLAVSIVVVWAVLGPVFQYSDTWQLVINTGTTIITFLMVFLIQSSQNRDTLAIHVKLDELIRAVEGARNALLDLEDLDQEEAEAIRRKYLDLACEARRGQLPPARPARSS